MALAKPEGTHPLALLPSQGQQAWGPGRRAWVPGVFGEVQPRPRVQ